MQYRSRLSKTGEISQSSYSGDFSRKSWGEKTGACEEEEAEAEDEVIVVRGGGIDCDCDCACDGSDMAADWCDEICIVAVVVMEGGCSGRGFVVVDAAAAAADTLGTDLGWIVMFDVDMADEDEEELAAVLAVRSPTELAGPPLVSAGEEEEEELADVVVDLGAINIASTCRIRRASRSARLRSTSSISRSVISIGVKFNR